MAEARVGTFLRDIASHTGSTLFIETHSEQCPGCRAFLRSLDSLKDDFAVWDARLVVQSTGAAHVVALDRYGQVFYSVDAGAAHRFPAPRELVEWLKHLGTLCPE